MKILNKEELNSLIGKVGLFDNPKELTAKIDYIGGIEGFDSILKGKSQNEYGAVIHLIKHPKGLHIKLAETFKSNSIALVSDNIEKVVIEYKESIIKNKDKSVVGRAVVGGLLLGPIGAVVGGLSGLKSGQQLILPDTIIIINYKYENSKLELFFSCKKDNLIETINFFKSIGIKTEEKKESDKTVSITDQNIDKLERLAKLKADGFLTNEEFEEQKKKLL